MYKLNVEAHLQLSQHLTGVSVQVWANTMFNIKMYSNLPKEVESERHIFEVEKTNWLLQFLTSRLTCTFNRCQRLCWKYIQSLFHLRRDERTSLTLVWHIAVETCVSFAAKTKSEDMGGRIAPHCILNHTEYKNMTALKRSQIIPIWIPVQQSCTINHKKNNDKAMDFQKTACIALCL